MELSLPDTLEDTRRAGAPAVVLHDVSDGLAAEKPSNVGPTIRSFEAPNMTANKAEHDAETGEGLLYTHSLQPCVTFLLSCPHH